MKMPNKKVPKR